MDEALKKTCEWVIGNKKLLERFGFIITHDPVSSQPVLHHIFVHGTEALVFEKSLADSVFKKTYLTRDAYSQNPFVLGITKEGIRIENSELRILKRLMELQLPYVVPIQKITYLPTGEKAIIYGYCEGGDLEHYIRDHTREEHIQRAVTEALIEAVAGLHQHGILHRDIKPSNILLTLDAEGKPDGLLLSDFGHSTFIDNPQYLSHIEHSFCAPEANQAMETYKTELSDWYSLEKAKKTASVDAAWEDTVNAKVDPLTQILKRISSTTLYDSWPLGLTLYCLWKGKTFDALPWSESVKKLEYGAVAEKKVQFFNSLPHEEIPQDILLMIRQLLELDPKKRVSAEAMLKQF